MNSLLQVAKSHFFLQFVHLNRERGKVTAVTSSGHWGKRRDCGCQSREGGHGMVLRARAAAVNRGKQAIHHKLGGGGSYTQSCLKIRSW